MSTAGWSFVIGAVLTVVALLLVVRVVKDWYGFKKSTTIDAKPKSFLDHILKYFFGPPGV